MPQATVARGDTEDVLRVSAQDLTKTIADYKQAAKAVARLAKKDKEPKSKAAPKAVAKMEQPSWTPDA